MCWCLLSVDVDVLFICCLCLIFFFFYFLCFFIFFFVCFLFFFQAEDGIRDLVRSRGLGDVYKRQLLAQGLVMPTNMELFTCNVDGSELKQLTHLGKANWAPFFHPSGEKVIFSSNHKSQRGYQFNPVSYTHLTLPTSDLV
mgnify:CR=1 FL=1